MKTGTFKAESVDHIGSCDDFNNNFGHVVGKKTHVDESIGGKAKYRIQFNGHFDQLLDENGEIDVFRPKTSCHLDFSFPKGWTKAQMLETGLRELGFKTGRSSLNHVTIVGLIEDGS